MTNIHTYVYIHICAAVHHLPVDYYERNYQRIVVFWATVTFALFVGGEVYRDATRAAEGQAFSRVLLYIVNLNPEP